MRDVVLTPLVQSRTIALRSCDDARAPLQAACAAHPDLASYHELGKSEEGRPLDAAVIGSGSKTISLIAGAHSDEPVGPETLRHFIISGLAYREQLQTLFSQYKFVIVPHINPDGEARNLKWMRQWPDFEAYLRHVFRELPGRDLEFGFPDMRVENRLVADFMRQQQAPVALHMSLHGMGVCDGAMLLIEKNWIGRTETLRENYAAALREHGFRLHDHDRKGEKGFVHIAPGFTTTPEGRAMREHFESQGDTETAEQFHDSSMEFMRSLGGDPLCLVTELPLFIIDKKKKNETPGVPETYLAFKQKLPVLKQRLERGESITETIEQFKIRPADLHGSVALQLKAMELGLDAITSA